MIINDVSASIGSNVYILFIYFLFHEMFAFPDIIHKMLERVFILFHVKVTYRALNPAAKGTLPRRSNAFCLSLETQPYEQHKTG